MRILKFEIEGLFGRTEYVEHECHPDLNILTGRNGSGKTSVLKLLWSIISGNILVGLEEINFARARVLTDEYDCTVHRLGRRHCKVEIEKDGSLKLFEDVRDHEDDVIINAEDEANRVLMNCGRSVFFPTFRRIEGGFTIVPGRQAGLGSIFARQTRAKMDLEEALASLSRTLTHDPHHFVSAISTADIVTLLLRKYADLSDEANQLQARTSQDVIQTIRNLKQFGDDQEQLQSAHSVLNEVRQRIELMERGRDQILAPMREVRDLVQMLFQHSGISFGPRLSFGEAAKAVNSDVLSAGEKQMLSFVCYNAFFKNSIIFIDEPELSLHVDWQRQLFPILDRQQSQNQFIVATHSPFIYGKYPDKEIEIASDRGDSE